MLVGHCPSFSEQLSTACPCPGELKDHLEEVEPSQMERIEWAGCDLAEAGWEFNRKPGS